MVGLQVVARELLQFLQRTQTGKKKENQNTPCREINMQMKTIKVFQNYKLWYSPRNETTQRITEIVINTICSWKSKYKFEINHNENLY